MSELAWVGIASIVMASVAVSVGSLAPALAEGRAIVQALASIAQQPDEANGISRTLFIGLAIIETSGIYCFVIAIILLFANPVWNTMLARATGQ
jgi:F-type H+-transporting ATPase subunit c